MLTDILAALHKLAAKLAHRGENIAHMSYLGLVGWEAHGNYRYAAIILLGFVIHSTFYGDE